MLTTGDEIYLFDIPANPINIPGVLTMSKPPPSEPFDPAGILETMLNRLHPDHRSFVRIEKLFGKYFYKILSGDELKQAKRMNSGVIEDIKSEQEALDFAVKLKGRNKSRYKSGPATGHALFRKRQIA